MRKFLLLLGLFPTFVMAERSQCYEFKDLKQLADCYDALGNSRDIKAEADERLEHWYYLEEKDEMRSQSTYFALLNSKKSDIGLAKFFYGIDLMKIVFTLVLNTIYFAVIAMNAVSR